MHNQSQIDESLKSHIEPTAASDDKRTNQDTGSLSLTQEHDYRSDSSPFGAQRGDLDDVVKRPPAVYRSSQIQLEVSKANTRSDPQGSPPFFRYHSSVHHDSTVLDSVLSGATVQSESLQYPPSHESSGSQAVAPQNAAASRIHATEGSVQGERTTGPKKSWFKRNWWWFVPLNIVLAVGMIYYFSKQDEIVKATKPMRKWLARNEAWSWTIPVAILMILSFPPLIGHELVQLIVGLVYDLPVAVGIACLGAILGEFLVFLVFKYTMTNYVSRRCEERMSWATMQRVLQEAGFRGILIIRYSIVPPHLANPLFATTKGHTLWLYMTTVVLSLPKQIIFVVLGDPSLKDNKGATVAKVVAIIILILITIWGSMWVKRRLQVAKREIQAERDEALMDKTRNYVAEQS